MNYRRPYQEPTVPPMMHAKRERRHKPRQELMCASIAAPVRLELSVTGAIASKILATASPWTQGIKR